MALDVPGLSRGDPSGIRVAIAGPLVGAMSTGLNETNETNETNYGPGHISTTSILPDYGPGHHHEAALGIFDGPSHQRVSGLWISDGPGHHHEAALGILMAQAISA